MAQHFLLSSQAKSLSLAKVARMSDEDAFDAFRCIRWAETEGKPVCPQCGCAKAYTYKARKIFKCKGCSKQFSVTSGTIFADRKLPIRDYLLAIAIFANGAKGYSMLQLSRDLGVSYKAAFVLAHKLRKAMAAEQQDAEPLSGHVEVDGGYFGGHIRPANHKENRIDRRRARYQTGKRRVVVVMRERNGRTLPHVYRSEAAAVPHVAKHVDRNATLYADEAVHWDALHARFLTKRINHQQAYSTDDASTNQAESYFSRLRRAEVGTHHHISGKYLPAYALEMAWREDRRRVSNGEQFLSITRAALVHPASDQWKGYWSKRA
ncbi:MAG: IS1595 family transposase [Roseitalea porphyridii]|uniref:IS1595 family transposase n=1 Tax=Roseitalea porphyridii TaxID=1852022 RepID=UPI0032D94985